MRWNPNPPEAEIRQDVVSDLHRNIRDAIRCQEVIPSFIREAIDKQVWQRDRIFAGGSHQGPISFAEFVRAPYPVGLGSTSEKIRPFLAHDAALLATWDELAKLDA